MFDGLMPAMVTPFDEQGELDFEATEAVIERFIEVGVSGISPLGSTGEATHLTFDERKRFAERVVGIVGGRVPLVVGVGARRALAAVQAADTLVLGKLGGCGLMDRLHGRAAWGLCRLRFRTYASQNCCLCPYVVVFGRRLLPVRPASRRETRLCPSDLQPVVDHIYRDTRAFEWGVHLSRVVLIHPSA